MIHKWKKKKGKVKFGQTLKVGSKHAGVGVLFVTTYHPKCKKMKKLEHLLYQDESVKRLFTPPPLVSCISAKKLSSYLVCAKLYPLKRKKGSILTLLQAPLQVNHLR